MFLKVLENRKETKDVFSLVFKKPENYFFYPGQYIDVELPVKDGLGKTRTFSFSSSPTERFLILTAKKGVTPYKKYMEEIKPE